MSEPLAIRIPPDHVGYLHELRVDERGRPVEARVSWMDFPRTGWHAEITEHQAWVPLDRIQLMDGDTLDKVPRAPLAPSPEDEAVEPASRAVVVPLHWPATVPPPGTEGWQKAAVSWLLEQVPADYRAHLAVWEAHPYALAQTALTHLRHAYTAHQAGYRRAAVDLKGEMPPHALAELHEVYREERERLKACGRAAAVMMTAFRDQPTA